jgi:hypothetical protein
MEPEFKAGEKVYSMQAQAMVEVVRQILHYDCGEEFYGNVVVLYEGNEHTVNCWTLRKQPDQGSGDA